MVYNEFFGTFSPKPIKKPHCPPPPPPPPSQVSLGPALTNASSRERRGRARARQAGRQAGIQTLGMEFLMLPAAGWRSTEEEEQTGPAGRLRSRSDKEEDECKYPFSRSLPPSLYPSTQYRTVSGPSADGH